MAACLVIPVIILVLMPMGMHAQADGLEDIAHKTDALDRFGTASVYMVATTPRRDTKRLALAMSGKKRSMKAPNINPLVAGEGEDPGVNASTIQQQTDLNQLRHEVGTADVERVYVVGGPDLMPFARTMYEEQTCEFVLWPCQVNGTIHEDREYAPEYDALQECGAEFLEFLVKNIEASIKDQPSGHQDFIFFYVGETDPCLGIEHGMRLAGGSRDDMDAPQGIGDGQSRAYVLEYDILSNGGVNKSLVKHGWTQFVE